MTRYVLPKINDKLDVEDYYKRLSQPGIEIEEIQVKNAQIYLSTLKKISHFNVDSANKREQRIEHEKEVAKQKQILLSADKQSNREEGTKNGWYWCNDEET